MSQDGKCSRCGAPHPGDSPGGLCERCLLEAVLVDREEEILRDLLEIRSTADRRTFVDEVCRDDPLLHARLQGWLANQEQKSASPPTAPAVGTGSVDMLGGRYRLLQEIGEGGFGTVYLAEQTTPVRRQVALKILKLGMDTRQVVARFEQERQTLALMEHPGIAKVLDAGATETGRPYFVMELVRGRPITQFCEEEKLSIPERLASFEKVCQAVQHAHQKGIIHRDLKPSNILVAGDASRPEPKVIDFGIAKALEPGLSHQTLLTQEHQLLGTPAYISPEQADLASADIDTRSDIYSLGVLLYELLTGSTPFDTKALIRSGFDEMRRTIREKEPARPSTRLAETHRAATNLTPATKIHPDLDWIVLKSLQKDRNRRYATANGLAMDIQRHLHDEPVAARPPTMAYRVSKLVRRNPVVISLAGLLAVALVTAGVAGTWMSLSLAKAKRASDEANRKLSGNVLYLESIEMERLSADGRRTRPLAWLAHQMRQNGGDTVAASRALSMLSLHNFVLPTVRPLVHNGLVFTAQFSSDGQRVLTGGEAGKASFWDSNTGKLQGVITNGAAIRFGWFADNDRRVVLLGRDDTVRVYDSTTHALVLELSDVNAEAVGPITLAGQSWLYASPHGQTLARWDLSTGRQAEPTVPFTSPVQFVECATKADCLAVICADKTIHVLRASTGEALLPPRRFAGDMFHPRFTPDAARLFVPRDGGKRITVWNLHGTNELTDVSALPGSALVSLNFSPDGRRFATWSWAAPVRIWDAATLRLLNEPVSPSLQGESGYAFSPDGSLLAGFSQDGTARIWDAATGRFVFEPFEHQGWIRNLAFDPRGRRIVTASQDGTARIWDIAMRRPPRLPLPPSTGGGSICFSADGSRILLSVAEGAIQVCDARTGQPVGPRLQHQAGLRAAHIRDAAFSHDGSRIVSIGQDGLVRLWNARSYQVEHEFNLRQNGLFAQFSPDDRFVVTGDSGGYATVWNCVTGLKVGAPPRFTQEVTSLDLSPNAEEFLAASADGTARCWSLLTAQPVSPFFRHRGIIWSAAYSPDGTRVLTASADRTAQIWNAHTGQPLFKPFQHAKDVLLARFSPNGRSLLTTSEDATARVWDATTGAPRFPLLRHGAKIWAGAFSPDSRWVATGSDDQTVRLWDAGSGLPISEPLPHSGPIGRLTFSPHGHRLASFGGQPELWEVQIAPAPIPSWFPDLVETVAGARMAPDGELETVPAEALNALRQRFATALGSDYYTRWAKWFLADRLHNPAPACPVP